MPTQTVQTLREWRKARGNLTQAQLAKDAGISEDTINNVEREATVPSLRVALALAAALHVHVEQVAWPKQATAMIPSRAKRRKLTSKLTTAQPAQQDKPA